MVVNRTPAARSRRARARSGLPALGLVLAISLSACSIEDSPGSWSPPSTPTSGEAEPTTGEAAPTTEAPAGEDLLGTWELRTDFLQDSGQTARAGERPPALTFEDGTLAVDTGCNTGSGDYEVSGDEITLGPVALTMRACDGPTGALESVVIGLLAAENLAFGIDDETLTLTAEDGTTLAFERSEDRDSGESTATTSAPSETSTATTSAPTGTSNATTSAPTETSTSTAPDQGGATSAPTSTQTAPAATTTP